MTSRTVTGLPVRVESLRHVYHLDGHDVVALKDIDLDVAPGTTLAIVGPSGSGKSTLMTLLAGLQRPTSGRIYVGDDDLVALPERDLLRVRAQRLGVVVQNSIRNLLPFGDAEDNIRFAQRGPRSYHRRDLPDPAGLLRDLGMDHLVGARADRLSGGERQRLALAVGVASAPGVLLADEPTSALDRVNRDRVTDLVSLIAERFGTTVIAVTHDPEVAASLSRTVLIHEGRLTSESAPLGDAPAPDDHG